MTTSPLFRRCAALVPGMYPAAPKRNLIVAVLYLYAFGIAVAAVGIAG